MAPYRQPSLILFFFPTGYLHVPGGGWCGGEGQAEVGQSTSETV